MPALKRMLLLPLLVLLLSLSPPAHAQQPPYFIDIQPDVGPPGSTVVINGRGLPPNIAVRVLYAPFTAATPCAAASNLFLVAELRTDFNGAFVATHLTQRLNADHLGNAYVAQINEGPPPRAFSDRECFTFGAPPGSVYFPETGYVVGGRFLSFWQQNGGLYVFGYPLSNELQENGRTTQYFERARFEWFPENAAPYDVQLGRVGVELLARRGIDWQTQPRAPGPAPGCLFFPETQHNVCNQQRGIGFLSTWQANGLEFDGQPGKSYAESLALFGFPITEPYQATLPTGETLQIQWFERARFEWHPENPDPYKVLLGRLGAEYLQGQP